VKIDYEQHYNDDYWLQKKTYRDANGVEKRYQGPSTDWTTGWPDVANVMSKLLPKGNLLDIGCGGAGLSGRLRGYGFESYGVDVSTFAAENCVTEMLGRIEVGDVTTFGKTDYRPHGIKSWDAIIATDFPEHIYETDIDQTFSYIRDLLKPGGVAFFLVATVDQGAEQFIHTKGAEVPLRFEGTAIAGHICMADWKWWTKRFTSLGFKMRWDLRCLYQQMREMVPWWKQMDAWRLANAYFLSV